MAKVAKVGKDWFTMGAKGWVGADGKDAVVVEDGRTRIYKDEASAAKDGFGVKAAPTPPPAK